MGIQTQTSANLDLCDGAAVLHLLSYQANCELVIMWVNYKPIGLEIDDDNRGIFRVFDTITCSQLAR